MGHFETSYNDSPDKWEEIDHQTAHRRLRNCYWNLKEIMDQLNRGESVPLRTSTIRWVD